MSNRTNKGFTLIELMIVVAIIAIIASIAIPNLLSARLSANESAAISTLRNIVSAQAQIQAQAAIDEDADGIGEHGSFAEMAGVVALRAAGVGTLLTPPVLSGALGNTDANGYVQKAGYYFLMHLPDNAAAPLPEAANGAGPDAGVDPDLCENTWNCFAWPVNRANTGNRTFMVNQSGDMIQTAGGVVGYDGTDTPIATGLESYDPAGAGDMGDALALGIAGNDGNTWVSVN